MAHSFFIMSSQLPYLFSTAAEPSAIIFYASMAKQSNSQEPSKTPLPDKDPKPIVPPNEPGKGIILD